MFERADNNRDTKPANDAAETDVNTQIACLLPDGWRCFNGTCNDIIIRINWLYCGAIGRRPLVRGLVT